MATVKELEAKIAELEKRNAELEANTNETPRLIIDDMQHKPMRSYEPAKKVTIELFKDDYKYKEPLFVGINGRTWMIPRGVPVQLDDYVAEFIENQKSEEARIMRKVEAEEIEYQKNTASMGK
jgi:hypothetical protein